MKTPELEVYTINVRPLTPKDLLNDKHLIHDWTLYDDQIAFAFATLIMTRELTELASSKCLSKNVDWIL
jgi:NTE family protein